MKKLFIIALSLFMIISFSACNQLMGDNIDDDNINLHNSAIFDENAENQDEFSQQKNNDFIFSWLSYIELTVNSERDTREEYEKYIAGLFEDMKRIKVNNLLVHTRAYADALYKSDIFPLSEYILVNGKEPDFDPLEIVTATAKKYDIKVHAWINPYRISKSDDISTLSENHIAKKWHSEENQSDVFACEGKLYFSPSSERAQKLIIDGARELLEKYDISGIHIDDYFYPQNCGDFDAEQYQSYTEKGGKLSLAQFRRENVSNLVSCLYSTVKQYGKDKLFTISPCGNIEKAYNELFADVYLWCSQSGYADAIMPQIYFGFENESMPFLTCLDAWLNITDTEKVKLVPGLALYKAGKPDKNAGKGENEWADNSDVISRQIEAIGTKDCAGFALYSASYINFYETFSSSQVNTIKNVIQ